MNSSNENWPKRDTLVSKFALRLPLPTSVILPVEIVFFESYSDQTKQSSAQPTHKKFSASKDAASENLPLSSKSASSSLRTPSRSTLPKSKTVVSQPSPNASLYATNCSTVWP
jgi:hypothetical protein